jgi:hypothetical protein
MAVLAPAQAVPLAAWLAGTAAVAAFALAWRMN